MFAFVTDIRLSYDQIKSTSKQEATRGQKMSTNERDTISTQNMTTPDETIFSQKVP